MMAKSVGVCAAWAKYGTYHTEKEYSALVRITHWTEEDVERELSLKKQSLNVTPDYVLEDSFGQIIGALI